MKGLYIVGIIIAVLIIIGIILTVSGVNAPDTIGFLTLGFLPTTQISTLCDINGNQDLYSVSNLSNVISVSDLNIFVKQINYSTFFARNHVVFDWSGSDINAYNLTSKLYLKDGVVKFNNNLWMCLYKISKTSATIFIKYT